ncbi:MAG: beta-phosphoglucomutase [Nitriliruptoraceae bacterium]
MSEQRGAVIFDLDGVLTDTAELHAQAWRDLAARHGFAVDDVAIDALRGRSRADSLRALLGGRTVAEATFDAMLAEKNAHYARLLTELGPDDLLDGALDVLDDAEARGFALAIGSSSKNARLVLERLGIADRFVAIVDGTQLARAKPAPDVFLVALAALDVPSSRTVVIEDAAAGVDAAHAAGLRVIGVGPADRVGHADHHVARTADVDLAVVEDWFERGAHA